MYWPGTTLILAGTMTVGAPLVLCVDLNLCWTGTWRSWPR